MFGEAKLLLGIIIAACILGNCIELIRTNCSIRLDSNVSYDKNKESFAGPQRKKN